MTDPATKSPDVSTLPIVERLRQDRLLNPDYATRNEAAALIDELVETLKLARPRLAHKFACWSRRPTSEWAEHGSASYENCDCEIKVVDALLAKLGAAQ
jgi:hypothetical protein